MSVGFISNISKDKGAGHFYRCLALSKIFEKKKKIIFHSSDINNLSLSNDYKVIKIKKNILSTILKSIENYKIKIIIIDDYKLSYKIETILKKKVDLLVVIDDFYNRKHNCDILINYNDLNLKQKKIIKFKNKRSSLALGLKYLIIDKKILQLSKFIKVKKKIKNILVFFGSADHTNEIKKLVHLIRLNKDINFNIVLNKMNQRYKNIKEMYKKQKNAKIYSNCTREKFIDLMAKNDLGIGAGGTNLYERIFLGLPSLVVQTSDNQYSNIKYANKKKLIIDLGSHSKLNSNVYVSKFNDLLKNKKLFTQLSNNCLKYNKLNSLNNLANLFNLNIG